MKVSCSIKGMNWQRIMLPVARAFFNTLDNQLWFPGCRRKKNKKLGAGVWGCNQKWVPRKNQRKWVFKRLRVSRTQGNHRSKGQWGTTSLREKTGPSNFRMNLPVEKLSNQIPALRHCLSHDWAHRVPIFLCFDTEFTLLAPLHNKISAFLPCVLPLPWRTWSFLSWQLSWTWRGKLPGVKIHVLVAPPPQHSSLYHSELIDPKLWYQHSGLQGNQLQKWMNASDLPYTLSNISSLELQMIYIKSAPCFLSRISHWWSAAYGERSDWWNSAILSLLLNFFQKSCFFHLYSSISISLSFYSFAWD